jgi:hypothetical protein
MSKWIFTDADEGDELTKQRIAVTSSHPGWAYLVAFDRQSEARPTDREAAMLASYLESYKDHWYNARYRAEMEARPLDIDGGANGVIFHKWAEDDWGYRRRTFTMGWLFSVVPPWMREDYSDGIPGPISLGALLDRIHTFGDKPSDRWLQWKADHPNVFEVDR